MSRFKPLTPAFAIATAIAAVSSVLCLGAAPAAAEWTGPCIAGTAGPTCHFWRGKLLFVDDGDTIDVRMPTSTGKRKVVRVRITGIQAMEQSVYSSRPSRRRGDCHALEATARLVQLLRLGHGIVRLSAQDPTSTTGGRLRRSVSVHIKGSWVDVGRVLMAEGHTLWLPNSVEYAWNATYARLGEEAAAQGLRLWDTRACGAGPSATQPLRLFVRWDAPGNDFDNVDGELVRLSDLDPLAPVPLAGWWVRDSALRRYTFPSWAAIPAGGSVTVHVGKGASEDTTFYWGLHRPAFENAMGDPKDMGDGAYLFDPQGDLRAWQVYH